MATKRRAAGLRGRPRLHDPDVIARLLAERAATGESLVALAARSGIPSGTLSGYASRERSNRRQEVSPFVEVMTTATEDAPVERSVVPTVFCVIVEAGGVQRHVLVPAGFDDRELLRLVAVLESRC